MYDAAALKFTHMELNPLLHRLNSNMNSIFYYYSEKGYRFIKLLINVSCCLYNCFAEPFWGGEGFLHAHKFWNPTVLLPYLAKALGFLTALFSNASLLCIWLKPNHWGILAHMTKSSHNLAEAWNSWQTLPRESPRTELAEGINSPLTRSKSNAFWIEN